MVLVIGNKRYSSWSLRPWILMRHFALPFQEKLIALDQPDTTAEILQHSPSGKVPALIDGDVRVWESLAIAEYLAEKFPEKQMWPREPKARAWARSVSGEMHAGFQTMRELMSHDVQKELKVFDSSSASADIQRVQAIWSECLKVSRGPFLFGDFSIADAMFAPVVNRFVSYAVTPAGVCAEYMRTMLALPALQQWNEAGRAEKLRVPRYET